MANPKKKFSTGLKLLTAAFFLIGVLVLFTLLSIAVISLFWITLPVLFFLLGIGTIVYVYTHSSSQKLEKISDETEEKYQNRLEIHNAIKQFKRYAKGKISIEDIAISPDSDLYQWLFHSQKAYFSLQIQAEIDRGQETKEENQAFEEALQKRVMGSLEKSYAASKKLNLLNEKEDQKESKQEIDNTFIFNRLFTRIKELTSIKRPIYQVNFDGFMEHANVAFKRRRKFVLFGIEGDGNCYFYCINVRTREEVLDLIIKHLNFNQLKHYVYEKIFYENLKSIGLSYKKQDTELNDCIENFIMAREKQTSLISKHITSPEELNEKIRSLKKTLDEKIKFLISYEDNKEFAAFIKKYMHASWFDNAIIDELSNALYCENPKKNRETAHFDVSLNEKNALFLKYAKNGCYRFVWGEISEDIREANIENDTLHVWIKDNFFHYRFKDPNGIYIKNKADIKIFDQYFSKAKEDLYKVDYNSDTLIQKIASNNLANDDEKFFAEAIMLFTIAEKEDYGPQSYFYNYFCNGIHVNRFVELNDDEELIRAKTHENYFKLCQNQKDYDNYEKNWIRPGLN